MSDFSYVHGADRSLLIELTIGNRLNKSASRWKDKDALVVHYQNIRWSYAELQQRVDKLAAGFIPGG